MKNKMTLIVILLIGISPHLFAQQTNDKNKQAKDSIRTTKVADATSDRNVMLNASDNTKPRDVNIGLPAAAGGMNIVENGLPVAFTLWPEIPSKSWRQDATLNGFKLQNITNTAIDNGGVGFTVETTNNLGTDEYKGVVMLNSNHFGLLNGTMNLSGPINKKGLQFSVGAYANYDPGYFKTDATNYYSDQTQLYKVALSQKYKLNGRNGRIAVFYKYANSGGATDAYNPFEYQKGGKVKEVNGLKIGRTPFFERSGNFSYLNPFTKEIVEENWMDYSRNKSHTLDFIGYNELENKFKLNYTLRFHKIGANIFSPQTGQSSIVEDLKTSGTAQDWVYFDGGKKINNYTGAYVVPTNYRGYGGDIKTYSGIVELSKKNEQHDWKVGLTEQHYILDDYFAGTTTNYISLEENPSKIVPTGGTMSYLIDKFGNLESQYNGGLAYFEGWENKLSVHFSDKWTINSKFTLNYGARLEWKRNQGDYAPGIGPNGGRYRLPSSSPIPEISKLGAGVVLNKKQLTEISDSYLNKTIQASAVYNLSRTFGFLGEVGYNEVAPQLENYAGALEVNPKQASIPNAGFGIFFNHPMINIVSKATYIKRDNYVARISEKNPQDPTINQTETVTYDIETMGWTTDILAKPFLGFQLHLLFTLQAPNYKNYEGDMTFTNGDVTHFDFSDKTVSGISKMLIEIDPSYAYKKFKVWASARYFSKEYANMSNTIFFKPRWETFIGGNYNIMKGLDFGVTVVNPLNQLGAKGALQEMDLYTEKQITDWLDSRKVILAGKTIRPFTVEFSAKYRF